MNNCKILFGLLLSVLVVLGRGDNSYNGVITMAFNSGLEALAMMQQEAEQLREHEDKLRLDEKQLEMEKEQLEQMKALLPEGPSELAMEVVRSIEAHVQNVTKLISERKEYLKGAKEDLDKKIKHQKERNESFNQRYRGY